MMETRLSATPRFGCLREAARQMPGVDFSICELFLHLLQAGSLAARCEADFLAAHGLNQTRLVILALLDQAEGSGLRSSELAEQACVSRATMTGLLDTLEKAGLLQRAPDAQDRRATNVKITDAGRTLIRKVHPLQFRWVKNLLEPLSPPEREKLIGLLRKTQNAFRGHPASSRISRQL